MRFDRLRILLVDDNHHMRVLLAEVLRAIGVREIHDASDGNEALAVLREREVDIIMTDLAMPGVDGLEFIRLIRNAAESPHRMAPIIVVTGHSTVKAVRQARDAGANEFLTKPISARGLIDRIEQVIEHGRPFIQSADYFGPDRRRHDDAEFKGPWRRSTDTAQQKAAEPAG